MDKDIVASGAPMRPPSQVMRLERMGCFHGSPLSFMRQLTRRMAGDAWTFSIPVWEVDAHGVGRAVLQADTGARTYALVAFFHDLPDEARSDRVIATAWDATFTLFDGVPTDEDLERHSRNVPVQEAGRVSLKELTLSRANRSVRLWDGVISALSQGQQPDVSALGEVGYLMRTTAVYGSGKFGAADRDVIADRAELSAPFQAEMLTVYLIRWAVLRLVDHLARARGGTQAVALDPDIARGIGIGNSTGLGMAPFLMTHPKLIHNWITAREGALTRVKTLGTPTPDDWDMVLGLARIMLRKTAHWRTDHSRQKIRDTAFRDDLTRLVAHMSGVVSDWTQLFEWSEAQLSLEGQEWLVSAALEPYVAGFEDLAQGMCGPSEAHRMDGQMRLGALRAAIRAHYGWALELDWDAPEAVARAWYVSAEKLEPRLGERAQEPIAPYEQPLAPGRDVAALWDALETWPDSAPVAALAMAAPVHRYAIRRVQIVAAHPYAEIHDNTIAAEMMPIDLLRAKLAFFGAQRFDPRSDRWVRICMFAGAPLPSDMTPEAEVRWPYWLAPWETPARP